MIGVVIVVGLALVFGMGYSAGQESIRKKLNELIHGKAKGRK